MRAKELVTELANKPYPYSMGWYKPTPNGVDGRYDFATADGVEYEVSFYTLGPKKVSVYFSTSEAEGPTFYDPTKTGDEFRVFATVIDIIKSYTEKFKPKTLVFSTNASESRKKLYNRYIKNIKNYLPKYELASQTGVKNDPTYSFYELTRISK